MADDYKDLGAVPAQQEPNYDDDLGAIPADTPPPEPDMDPMRKHFQEALKAKPVTGIMDAIEAGWQTSVAGLATRGKAPEMAVAEDAGTAAKVASGIAQLAGDLPAIIPGTIAGAAAGTAVFPGPGTLIGGAGVGNAAPAAIRKILMDHYEKGDIVDAKDFVERSMGVLWETSKQFAVGVATAGVGNKVGKIAAPIVDDAMAPVVSKVAARLAQPASEIVTMATAGKAVEGQLPNLEDFTNAALMVGTIHGAVKLGTGGTKSVTQKMKQIYAETGVRPEQVVEDVKTDPVLQQELLSDNPEIPKAYEHLKEEAPKAEQPAAEPVVTMNDVVNEPKPEITPEHPAVRKILENIEGAPKPSKERYSVSKAYTDFVDRLFPIKEALKSLEKDSLPPEENPYNLARMANDFKAKVRHVMERGTLDFNTLEVNGKSLREIVDPFKDNLREFEAFLVSKRALDYEKRGLGSGFDLEAAKEVVKMGEKKYGQAAKDLVVFQLKNLKYLRDAGLVDADQFGAMMKAGENYVPLKRILDPGEFEVKRGKGGTLRRVKGVEDSRDIKTQSPLLSIMENTESIMRMAEKNRAVKKFVSLAEESGMEGVIEKVKQKSRPIEISAKEIEKFIDSEAGVDGESFSVFRPNRHQLGENEFEVIRDGKREVYRTTKELAEAFKSLDGDGAAMGILVRLLSKPVAFAATTVTAVKRIGITMTPDFVARNFLRDQMTSAITSKGRVIPFVDAVVAMGDLFKKNDTYYNWLKSGGAQGSFMELNDRYLMKDVFKLNKETGILESTWNLTKKPVDAFFAFAHAIEMAPRLAEFKKVSGGEGKGAGVFRGGFAAREVTLDFQRRGARLSALNLITAFMNASVQGVDKFARTLRENPTGAARLGVMAITAPSIYLWWANKDDPRYKAIPRWERDLNWIVLTDKWVESGVGDHPELMPEYLKRVVNGKLMLNKGVPYKLPKPFEFGVLFGALPERILEKLVNDDPRAFKDFDETVSKMLIPSMIPDIVAPAIEQWANKNLFTDRQMIPYSLEKVAPEYQYTDYTSESAKQLAKLTSWAAGPDKAVPPIVIDNYIRQWSGSVGQYAVGLADKYLLQDGGKVQPESSLADIPAIKAFVVRYPGSDAQQITDFYDRKKQIDEKLATIRHLKRSEGMEEELDRYLENTSSEGMARFNATEKALSNSRKEIRAINANPKISPREKRQLIDGKYYLMIEAARSAMRIADELDKNLQRVSSK